MSGAAQTVPAVAAVMITYTPMSPENCVSCFDSLMSMTPLSTCLHLRRNQDDIVSYKAPAKLPSPLPWHGRSLLAIDGILVMPYVNATIKDDTGFRMNVCQ